MLKKIVKEYINQNSKIVIGLLMCVVVGVVSGIIIFVISGSPVKSVVIDQMNETLKTLKTQNFIDMEIVYNGLKNNLILIFLMMIFSVMLYGTVLIYFIYVFKGLSLGIYICTLFSIFGIGKGILAIFLLIVLVNVVYLPAFFLIGITLVDYNINFMEYKKEVRKVVPFTQVLAKLFFGVVIIFSSIIVETLLSGAVI